MQASTEYEVVVSPQVYLFQIEELKKQIRLKDLEIIKLKAQLDYERELRENPTATPPVKQKRKKRDVTPETNTYSEFKSDGKRKAHAADSIRSYDDFKAIQDYFLNKNDVRDWAMWTIGVSLGIRISDLLSLKFGNFIDKDKVTIMPKTIIYEKKTGKTNDLLITESVRAALAKYIASIGNDFSLEDYLFSSRKTGEKMIEQHGWRIISDAGKALKLPLNIGSHTMRKSFANIAACVDTSCVDMNAITKIQGLLNHSDQKVTMKYLGTYQDMFDRARVAVSDFVLGKTDVNELCAGNKFTTDDVIEKLDVIEKMIGKEDRNGTETQNCTA